MTKILRIRCPYCSHWNRIEVDKIFVEQSSVEPKVKALIPMYKPLKTETCKKCKKVSCIRKGYPSKERRHFWRQRGSFLL